MKTLSLAKRRLFLDRVDFIRRLQAAGDERRASLIHRNLTGDTERMAGELSRPHLHASSAQRHELNRRVAELTHAAAKIRKRLKKT